MLKLVRVDMTSLFIVGEEELPEFLWLSQTPLSKGMIVDHICNETPFVSED